jgi:hypothetical protein
MSRASRAAALTADVAATRRRLDDTVDGMAGLHGPALNRQVRAAVALVNEAADTTAKIKLLGGAR